MHYGLDTSLIRIDADTTSWAAISTIRSRSLPGDVPRWVMGLDRVFRFPVGAYAQDPAGLRSALGTV
jgi:hypothetical protein